MREKALLASLMQMYIEGVSTRKVKDITEKLCGTSFSKSHISELTKKLDEEIAYWRNRPLEKKYLYLTPDALYEKVRTHHRVVSKGDSDNHWDRRRWIQGSFKCRYCRYRNKKVLGKGIPQS